MLLISHYNHLQQVEGLNVYDSVVQGSLDRLNPILMTALSSALALIPLALGGDLPGNEIQSPMAKVILGGLLTSTFLNGFIVPIVYLMIIASVAPEQILHAAYRRNRHNYQLNIATMYIETNKKSMKRIIIIGSLVSCALLASRAKCRPKTASNRF